MTRVVDWSQPIEAVHEDGRVVAVELDPTHWEPGAQGMYGLAGGGLGIWSIFNADGSHFADPSCPWHIRNRPPEAQ